MVSDASPTHRVIPAQAGISVCGTSGFFTVAPSRATHGPDTMLFSTSVNRDSRFRGNDSVEVSA